MKVMTLAALLMQMTSSGGAGSEGKRAGNHVDVADESHPRAVKEDINQLKGEITSLKEQFRLARERQRLAAEEKQRQEEARYGVTPKATPAPAAGGSGAPAHAR
ncbi:hypothetical protein COCOR_04879 [Corallococcus coralloides DSM 2259]|uniref:Uncharacterized protein n=1 Tax=Corallococcus coralloides (strain ATCC 25202 / DSM 2259 / NBRC 100086 / M2) TaxID=1144275 RepID=H8MM98_CORCM|nr:hypothetical protein [Corallococcus coralloides]AFE06075.1 hypothetical protein COCOR_04879 [Corallococcus coralloides DSM 2259]